MKTATVIPCYNAEKYLAEALKSVLSQTERVDEIIVVDDCSTDSTRTVASNFPVTVLKTTENLGHANARNVAIEKTDADLIFWLDSDDTWESNHVATLLSLIGEYPEADVAYSGIKWFGLKTHEWNNFPCERAPKHLTLESFEQTLVPAMSVATRTSALQKIGGFNAEIRYAPDFDLWLRMSLVSKFVCTSRITANYRTHSSQISSQPIRQIKSVYDTRMRFLRYAKINNPLLAGKLESKLTEILRRDLADAWNRRQGERLRFLYKFSQTLGYQAIHRQYHAKRVVPMRAMRTYDKLQAALHFLGAKSPN
jgi:glycosyltransferase involved in cell wall biosynthesis